MENIEEIGRYRVERLLGTGAFASVWLAHDDVLDSSVAVKVLADNWASRMDVRDRFLTEARLLRQADSDRVLRVLDIGELPDERPYFVTSFADGGSLEERLDGPMAPDEALPILLEVAEAVCVLHGMGVVHRDLKPSNVLFQGDRVVLADLGLAKALAQGSGLTQMAGSPGYMAPEQSRPAGIVDERTDVYGLGALAHRLLTGTVVDDPSAAPLPRPLGDVVRKALQTDPAKRWPTMRAFADGLRGNAKPSKRRWLPYLCAFVVAAAGATWWLIPRDTPTATPPAAVPPAVDPALCRADELRIYHNDADNGTGNENRWYAALLIEATTRTCDVFGYPQDFRLVTATGPLPRKVGDGTGEPKRVTLVPGEGMAEVSMSWSRETADGSEAPTPVRAEFTVPGTGTRYALPWGLGPVGDEGQLEIGPIGPAVN
ncbi:protein kinase [Amycolatopsis thailandensis]|uniref:protein kinase domain-containing protein n=1 Tax=Amycolatopsis thailandensis TaxID=589330 RepID=UPI003657A69F